MNGLVTYIFSWKCVLLSSPCGNSVCRLSGIWDRSVEREIRETNDQKLLFSSHDDISGKESRVKIIRKAFRKVRFRASNDFLLVDKELSLVL